MTMLIDCHTCRNDFYDGASFIPIRILIRFSRIPHELAKSDILCAKKRCCIIAFHFFGFLFFALWAKREPFVCSKPLPTFQTCLPNRNYQQSWNVLCRQFYLKRNRTVHFEALELFLIWLILSFKMPQSSRQLKISDRCVWTLNRFWWTLCVCVLFQFIFFFARFVCNYLY